MRSEAELRDALKRLQAGPGAKGSRYGLGSLEAHRILEDAITELCALRAATVEWVCKTCQTVYPRKPGIMIPTCPVCNRTLLAHSIVREDALRARVYTLAERVELLEEIVKVTYDEQEIVDLPDKTVDHEA